MINNGSISTDKINTVTISGYVYSIKEITGERTFIVIQQPFNKGYLFFPCIAMGAASEYLADEIFPGDGVFVSGTLGNWHDGPGKYKKTIIHIKKCLLLIRGIVLPREFNLEDGENAIDKG